MTNKKKLEGELISLGYDKKEREFYLNQFQEMFDFNDFMIKKYDLNNDDEAEKMYQLYFSTRENEIEKKLAENITDDMNEDEVVSTITDSIVNVSAEIMYDYAILHEYDKSEEFKNAVLIYADKLMRTQIKKTLIDSV